MRINTNVGALTASKNAFINTMATESSMRKLSSGLRISRAADDAAGLAIANNLRDQHRKLQMGVNNAEQGSAMLQIAEGAAQTIERIIERKNELGIQQGSSQNTAASAVITGEIAALDAEITRIAGNTTFQGTNVFGTQTFTVGDGSSVAVTVNSLSATSTLSDVNNVLAAIGAGQNRLEYTIQNTKSAVVNVKAAESTIRDVDMAEEMANFTKNNILTQAAQAMLSQANQGAQSVLQILR
jgi:flagellin